jgi:hypothetical protein
MQPLFIRLAAWSVAVFAVSSPLHDAAVLRMLLIEDCVITDSGRRLQLYSFLVCRSPFGEL